MAESSPSTRSHGKTIFMTAVVTGVLLLGLWLIRGGAGTEAEPGLSVPTPTDTGDTPLLLPPGPVIGAFHARVARRLAEAPLPTAPLAGELRILARDIRWNEVNGREFARAAAVTGRLATRPLHRGDIRLTQVAVTRPVVHLTRADGAWNYEVVLARLLNADGAADTRPRRVALLENVGIRGGTVDVRMPERSFSLEELNADLRSVAFSGPSLPEPRVVAATATAILVQPEEDRRLALRAEDATARILEESVAFDVARLTVEGARFAGIEGVWSPTLPWYGVEASGRAVGVALADIRQLLPERAPTEGTASFDFRIRAASATAADVALSGLAFEGDGSTITGDLTLRMLPERVELRSADLRLDPLDLSLARAFTDSLPFDGLLRGTVRGADGDIRFELAGDLRPTPVGEPFRVQLTGQAAMTAEGIALRSAQAELVDVPLTALRAYLGGAPLGGTVSGRLTLSGPPTRAPLTIAVDLSLATGTAHLEGTVDLTGAVPSYDLNGQLSGIDLQRLLLPAAPPVVLDGRVAIAGTGTDPETIDAHLDVEGGFRGWHSVAGDTLILAASARSGVLDVDTLRVRLATLSAVAGGEWGYVEPTSGMVQYAAEITALSPWGPYLPLIGDTVAAGTLAASGTVTGSLSQPRFEGELSGEQVRSGGWTAGRLEVRGTIALGGDVPEGRVDVSVRDFVTPTAGEYSSVTAAVTLARPAFSLELDAQKAAGGSVEVAASGHLPAAGPRDLVLQRAHVDLVEGRWVLAAPAAFRWGEAEGVTIEHFEMRRTAGDGMLRLDGKLLPLADVDFRVQTAALPIGEVQELLGVAPYATGRLWTETSVTGPGSAPAVEMQFRLEDGVIQGVTFTGLEGTVRYANASLLATAVATLNTEGAFQLELNLPAMLDLTAERKLALVDTGAVAGSLVAQAVSLTPFASLTPQIRDLTGRVDGRVTLTGTVAVPAFDGRLVLTGGGANFPALNQTFSAIQGQLALDGRRVSVEDFTVSSDGPLTVTGDITFEDLTSPVARLAVHMERFRPVDVRRQADAALWGDLTVTGPWDGLVVEGALRVADGYVLIPQFESGFDDVFADLPELAFGGGARSGRNPLVDQIEIRDLVVELGTDVWFMAEAARAQLGGRLVLNRTGDVFRIQGDLEGTRGLYTLQAGPIIRRFEILSARVRFLGTPDVNPVIDISARRVVFDPSGRQIEVEVHIGGTMRSPTLSLASADAPAFPESELLSVLFFGRQTLELGGAGVAGEAVLEGTVISGLAELASLELEEAIVGNLGLSLDIFQVRFGPGGIGGFGAPTFVFGWELGSDFFLTAESAIGALLSEAEPASSAWALRLEWAFDRRSRARIGLEPVAPYRSLRGVGLAPISRQPLSQQLSLEVRRRWNY